MGKSCLPVAMLPLLLLASCQDGPARPPTNPTDPAPENGPGYTSIAGELPPGLVDEGFWPPGVSTWRWTAGVGPGQEAPDPGQGLALLELQPGPPGPAPGGIRWVFDPPVPVTGAQLILSPRERTRWLSVRVNPALWQTTGAPLPLPRLPCLSDHYSDLVHFLKEMTSDYFESVVCHWPDRPIPVRVGQAVSGQVDLSACLLEAMAIWNQGQAQPWFIADETAVWGVRLVHFQGVIRRPPLLARITRLDDQGRPLRVNIIAGDNYDGPEDRPYAVRGLVHELGHALFLWGHSTDRDHVLWGAAPPLVGEPSPDERKAAQLWHGLPEGVDLSRYFSAP
jgi:hypothetical protein